MTGASTERTPRRSRQSIGRLPDLLPEEPPSRLHGDLWNGNVIWSLDGVARVIDPAAYGGHREADLAMLSLFGLPHLPRVLDAYPRCRRSRTAGRSGSPLHQLFPLLVHACMFGGGYGARAAGIATRFLYGLTPHRRPFLRGGSAWPGTVGP